MNMLSTYTTCNFYFIFIEAMIFVVEKNTSQLLFSLLTFTSFPYILGAFPTFYELATKSEELLHAQGETHCGSID